MFSAVLGLAGTAYSAYSARQGAQDAANSAAWDRYYGDIADQRQANFAMSQQGIVRDQLAQEQELFDYLMNVNDYNQRLLQTERDFAQNLLLSDRSTAQDEYNMRYGRMQDLDRDAAAQRAYLMEQVLRNQNLTSEEYQQALNEYNYAKAIASGQREEDVRQYRENRNQQMLERLFSVGEYEFSKAQAMSERDYEMGERDQIKGKLQDFEMALKQLRSDLGTPTAAKRFTEDDVYKEEMRRRDIYEGAIDRAADKVASTNEASLIRTGMDASTTGDMTREDLTAALAQEYQQAYQKAADDALAYINGKQDMLYTGENQELQRRGSLIEELMNAEGSPIDMLSRLNMPVSGVPPQTYTQLNTGVYDRDIMSALDYNAPIDISTRVLNPYDIGSSLYASYDPGTSIYDRAISSAMFSPNAPSVSIPGMPSNPYSSSRYTDMYRMNANSAAQQSSAFGSSMQDLLSDGGALLDNWWSGRNTYQGSVNTMPDGSGFNIPTGVTYRRT